MKITGKFKNDGNFTTVLANNTVYTIANKTGEWGCVSIGERTAFGPILTKECYEIMEKGCEDEGLNEGSFELKECDKNNSTRYERFKVKM